MAQKLGVALSKTFAFQDARVYLSDPWRDRAQQHKVDLVFYITYITTWSNILYVVDLSCKW